MVRFHKVALVVIIGNIITAEHERLFYLLLLNEWQHHIESYIKCLKNGSLGTMILNCGLCFYVGYLLYAIITNYINKNMSKYLLMRIIEGKTYDGVVKQKEEAQRQYSQAVSRGESAGIVRYWRNKNNYSRQLG